MRSSKRMEYQPARTIMFASLGWLFPAFTRFMGLTTIKPEYVKLVVSLDLTAVATFILTLIYLIYAMIYNANRCKKAPSSGIR